MTELFNAKVDEDIKAGCYVQVYVDKKGNPHIRNIIFNSNPKSDIELKTELGFNLKEIT